MLWGKAAGRCQFSGCNKLLLKHPVTQEQVNIAQAAHIYAFSEEGPRGNEGVDKDKLNDLNNLMLACHACHKTMDQDKEGDRYSVELLKRWKAEHERRVETVTGIDPTKNSHVLLYDANIGKHGSPLNYVEAAHALFPDYYPAADGPIELGMTNSSYNDSEDIFWDIEAEQLQREFTEKVLERVRNGKIGHLSVFGLAPQPLLIKLGTLLVDILPAQVYQRYREPTPTWEWPDSDATLDLKVRRPERYDGQPALVIGLTAKVADNRITSALPDACIWTVTTSEPGHDHIRSPDDLSIFRSKVRKLMDEIKSRHGQDTPLHIFPVAGNAVNIELGRIRMPKAMMPWFLYDQVNKRGGFVRGLEIN